MKVSGVMLSSGARTQLGHRVCLLVGAVSMEELDNNGCAQVPCRVATAKNELKGQLGVCQQFLPLQGSLQPHALGNLHLLSQEHFLQTPNMFKATSASI